MPVKSKETKGTPEAASYDPRDTVLGKVRGYPPWPAMVVDPESVPPNVAKERPQGKKTKFYCIRFFPAGDYAWVMPKDLSRLKKHEIDAYISEPYRKSGDLLKGYQAAADPSKWEEEHQAIVDAQNEAAANASVDELDESDGAEDDDEGSAKPKAKKRKRDSEAGVAKKPRASKKKDAADGPTRRKVAGSAKGSKVPPKSKAGVESEDEGDHADEAKQPSKKAKTSTEDDEPTDQASSSVKGWRHRLQKSFLTKDKPPKEDDMPALDELFKTIENFDMSLENLTWSKIGKVMRHIAKLSDEQIPRNAEFKFRERAQALVDSWSKILSTQGKNGKDVANGKESASEAAANGKPTSVKKDDSSMDVDPKPSEDAPAEKSGEKANGDATPGEALATELEEATASTTDAPVDQAA